MRELKFHLVNVFAESALQGNPLCVFEDGRTISDVEMQALAQQFNLSETTFILPSDRATRRMRIFTPLFEMPFAGHPTLGTAHVVRVLGGGDALSLETKAGVIPVTAVNDRWTLQIPNAHTTRPFTAPRAALAHALGIEETDISADPLYVDTGSDQFIVPLVSRAAVMRCAPNPRALDAIVRTKGERYLAYVFAPDGEEIIVSRFFFPSHGGMVEDPGTGSACANLGGYLLARGYIPPFTRAVDQGEKTGRRCALTLTVNTQSQIFVGGRCVRIGGGSITL